VKVSSCCSAHLTAPGACYMSHPGHCTCCCCPCSFTLALPSGPAPVDKCLGDPLDVTDIPGACRKQQRACSRPGQLDVSDIEGANAAWRPHHRCAACRTACRRPVCVCGSWDVGVNTDISRCRVCKHTAWTRGPRLQPLQPLPLPPLPLPQYRANSGMMLTMHAA
jgi:hypothetical protein